MSTAKQTQDAPKELWQSAFQFYHTATETLFQSSLAAAGFAHYVQEQNATQLQEWLRQSAEQRRSSLEKTESFLKETRTLHLQYQEKIQQLLTNVPTPFFATTSSAKKQ